MPDPFAAYVAGADPFAAFVAADTPLPPDPRVVAEMDRISPGDALLRKHQPEIQAELDQAAKDLPVNVALSIAPSVLGKVLPYAPGLLQKAVGASAHVLSKPAVGAAIGAYGGYKQGGLLGALTGGAAGYGGSKYIQTMAGVAPDVVAAGMSQAGREAQTPELLRALMRGANYDELAALVPPEVMARAGATVPSVKAAMSPLESELMARAKLAEPINWRTTDVTPLKRPGKGIHFGEESTPGLLKLLQDALLAQNAAKAEQIQTAIRQRSHITGKVGEP